MAIVKAPLKTDAAGKCTRWRVILYNPATHKQEWHTVNGTRRAAEAFEREQDTRLSKGTYVAKAERLTICLLYTSPSPRDRQKSRMPSSA